jgi:hypothetical protein
MIKKFFNPILATITAAALVLSAPAAMARVHHHRHAAVAAPTHHHRHHHQAAAPSRHRHHHGRWAAPASHGRRHSHRHHATPYARGHHHRALGHLAWRHSRHVRHAAVHRHTQLCQQVMIHEHWVSRCR